MLALAFAATTSSYTPILTYQPGSQVTDHANIDLDQAALESALGTLPSGFAVAHDIYTTGAHSKPTAECTLVSPTTLGAAVAKKAPVSFTSNNGDASTGKAYSNYDATATSVSFTYSVSDLRVQPVSSQCYVGGLPASAQSTDGCIAVGTGSGSPTGQSSFTIAGTTYLATCSNRGKRTLQGFSTKAQSVMYDCPVDSSVTYANGCPYTSYLPYYNYYGVYDYANQIVLAAIDGVSTSGFTNGGSNFASGSGAENVARKEFIKKGTAYMNAWMYAIREFEDAIDDCTAGDLTSNALSSGPVHAWDEGVGFYVGSLLVFDDLLAGNLPTLDSRGKLAYTLGNKRCKNYHTCGPDGSDSIGEAKANIELFELFRDGEYLLLAGECARIVPLKDRIVSRMTVPLVQGTLRYAYKMAALSGSHKEKAEGGIFAAAVLPQVHACDPAAATTIYNQMNINSDDNVDYNAVKAAFESCYTQMDITCSDVGGLWNSATDGYYNDDGFDASPCVDASTGMAQETIIVIAIAAAIFVLCLLVVICLACKEKSGKPVFSPVAPKAGAA